MSKKAYKSVTVVFFIWLIFFASGLHVAGAKSIFSKETYTIHAGQSILLNPSAKGKRKRIWSVKDEKIASVDSNGIVYGIAPGKTTVSAKRKSKNTVSTCVLEVLPPEPVRIVYATPNIAAPDSEICLCAVTNKNVEAVKFEIYNENYAKTERCKNKEEDGNTLAWSHKTSVPAAGIYNVKVWAKIAGSWQTCDNTATDILVMKKSRKTKASLKPRRVSDECINFISSSEGVRLKAYKDVSGNLTIGYGSLVWPFSPFYNDITHKEAFAMFTRTLNKGSFANAVNNFLVNNQIKFNQQQFDALVSFTYNIGTAWIYNSHTLKKILMNSGGDGQALVGIVNSTDGINLRETPDASGKRIGGLGHKTSVEILDPKKHNGEWYYVKTQGGAVGYCTGEFLEVSKINTGIKNLKLVNKDELISEMSAYHHVSGKKCSQSLLYRRFHELDIFLHGKYSRFRVWKYSYNYPIPECAQGLFEK